MLHEVKEGKVEEYQQFLGQIEHLAEVAQLEMCPESALKKKKKQVKPPIASGPVATSQIDEK